METDAQRRHRSIGTFGKFFIPAWIALAAIFAMAAASDFLFGFGWGYTKKDALGGLGMVAFGFLFWFVWKVFHGFLGELTDIFFGSPRGDEEIPDEAPPKI
ncbi:hypothetical protein [Qipengyuania gaetbuli]|uniref:hypothetical protein n=1 Tax=Qipengyuania gaetbuli TaxID=266952 RepID=UPI001CD2AAE2|nr:hypothetical protein [Qipengyuania gaetbuli]MCA0909842.1 hypothetical protein [Qipengyuania gaetbuli]